MTKSSVILSIL